MFNGPPKGRCMAPGMRMVWGLTQDLLASCPHCAIFLYVCVLNIRCLSSCFHSSKMMPTVGLYHVGSEEVDQSIHVKYLVDGKCI